MSSTRTSTFAGECVRAPGRSCAVPGRSRRHDVHAPRGGPRTNRHRTRRRAPRPGEQATPARAGPGTKRCDPNTGRSAPVQPASHDRLKLRSQRSLSSARPYRIGRRSVPYGERRRERSESSRVCPVSCPARPARWVVPLPDPERDTADGQSPSPTGRRRRTRPKWTSPSEHVHAAPWSSWPRPTRQSAAPRQDSLSARRPGRAPGTGRPTGPRPPRSRPRAGSGRRGWSRAQPATDGGARRSTPHRRGWWRAPTATSSG